MSDVENYTERDYAGSSIKIVSYVDRVQQLISINVFVGQYRSDLSATFPLSNRTAAATHYAFVQNGARAGRTEAAVIADLQRTPVSAPAEAAPAATSVALYRQRHGRRARLTAAQAQWYELARDKRGPSRGILGVEEVPSWLTLRALAEKGWADVLEREGGREAGRILRVRVREAAA